VYVKEKINKLYKSEKLRKMKRGRDFSIEESRIKKKKRGKKSI